MIKRVLARNARRVIRFNAIIGWPARNAMQFYAKTVQARVIEDSSPGICRRLVDA